MKPIKAWAIYAEDGDMCYYQHGPFIHLQSSYIEATLEIKRCGYDMSDKKLVQVEIRPVKRRKK